FGSGGDDWGKVAFFGISVFRDAERSRFQLDTIVLGKTFRVRREVFGQEKKEIPLGVLYHQLNAERKREGVIIREARKCIRPILWLVDREVRPKTVHRGHEVHCIDSKKYIDITLCERAWNRGRTNMMKLSFWYQLGELRKDSGKMILQSRRQLI